MAASRRKAEDIYPLLSELTPEEMIRLAYYALTISARLRGRTSAATDRPENGRSPRSLLGLCKDLGAAPGADEVDEIRQEIWGRFPRDDF